MLTLMFMKTYSCFSGSVYAVSLDKNVDPAEVRCLLYIVLTAGSWITQCYVKQLTHTQASYVKAEDELETEWD